jgi:hypothetical protein
VDSLVVPASENLHKRRHGGYRCEETANERRLPYDFRRDAGAGDDSDFATARACSTNSFASGPRVRFLTVMIVIE